MEKIRIRKAHSFSVILYHSIPTCRASECRQTFTHCKDAIPKIRNKYSQKKKLCGVNPDFHIHVSVSDLYIPRIGLPILLQENVWTDSGNKKIAHRHMNLQTGTGTAQFLCWEYINGIFAAVHAAQREERLREGERGCHCHCVSLEGEGLDWSQIRCQQKSVGLFHYYFSLR
jgi:hypothetical protein